MSKTAWEDSAVRYTSLLKGLDALIENMAAMISGYEKANMDFAYCIYGNNLTELLEQANCLTEYEREFMLMYYSLQGQVERLKRYREIVSVMTIRDPANCPYN